MAEQSSYCSCFDFCFINFRHKKKKKKSMNTSKIKILSTDFTSIVHRLFGPVQVMKKLE